MTGTVAAKPPVTWLITLEMNQAERDAWAAFLYRLKDGLIATGLEGETLAVFNNTASPLYQLFDTA